MNDNDQLKKMTANSISSKSNVAEKRRALLKGSAVMVPAIFTLKSGAAFALSSTGTCVSRDKVQAQAQITSNTLQVLQDPQDTWLRKAVPCRTLDDGVNSFRVYVEDILLQNQTFDWQDGVSRDDRYEEVGTDVPPKWRKRGAPAAPLCIIAPPIDQPADQCYVLVRVDDSSNITGLGLAGPLDTAPFVTQSCWASIGGPTP